MKSELPTLRRASILCYALAAMLGAWSLWSALASGSQAMSDRERLLWISTVSRAAERCVERGNYGKASYYLKAISGVASGTDEYLESNKEVMKTVEMSAQRSCE